MIMKRESCANGHVLEGLGNPTEMSEWQLKISNTTGANHLIKTCSFIPVQICLEQLHTSFNICPTQKIMKNCMVFTHISQRGLKL